MNIWPCPVCVRHRGKTPASWQDTSLVSFDMLVKAGCCEVNSCRSSPVARHPSPWRGPLWTLLTISPDDCRGSYTVTVALPMWSRGNQRKSRRQSHSCIRRMEVSSLNPSPCCGNDRTLSSMRSIATATHGTELLSFQLTMAMKQKSDPGAAIEGF